MADQEGLKLETELEIKNVEVEIKEKELEIYRNNNDSIKIKEDIDEMFSETIENYINYAISKKNNNLLSDKIAVIGAFTII